MRTCTGSYSEVIEDLLVGWSASEVFATSLDGQLVGWVQVDAGWVVVVDYVILRVACRLYVHDRRW